MRIKGSYEGYEEGYQNYFKTFEEREKKEREERWLFYNCPAYQRPEKGPGYDRGYQAGQSHAMLELINNFSKKTKR